jgi:hypothetical protein
LIYPMLYLVYSLIRGPIVDWYRYPFLDPDEAGGYLGVALYSVGITVGIGLFSWIIAALASENPIRRLQRPRGEKCSLLSAAITPGLN